MLSRKQAGAVVACLAWMGVSSLLILLNKHLLSSGFHFPMALSSLGMAFSSLASYICCRVLHIVEAKRSVSAHFYLTRILPVGLFMALTLHFGNAVYLHLSVAFIQMLKAFTPVITMVALFLAALERPTTNLILSVLVIAVGTAMASAGEINFSWLGVACMFASEAFESARLVMTQLLLTDLKFHPIEGLMYLAPACCAWLLLGVAAVEWPAMRAQGAGALVAAQPGAFLLAAALGFGVNSSAYIVIQLTSSLTLKVLGTVKNAAVVWLGILVFSEAVTPLQGLGYAITIAGGFAYQWVKGVFSPPPLQPALPQHQPTGGGVEAKG